MAKIFIDNGHGGSDSGAVSGGLVEKNMNLITGIACGDELKRYGVEVKYSRTTDVYLGLSERCKMANDWGADYFISQHYNAGGGDRGEVIHSIYRGKGLELSNAIAELLRDFGQSTMKVYEKRGDDNKDYYAVIRGTNCDAIIVEGGFIDNATDRQLFDTVEEQKQLGIAVAHGVLEHLGISVNKSTSTVSSNKVEPKYYVETSYIDPERYANGVTNFFNTKDIKFQLKHNNEGVFIQTMHMELSRCKAIAYNFTCEVDIMAYVWREDKITDAYGNISYTDRSLVQ